MKEFPLVLSMTQFQQYERCKKLFEFSAILDLNPRSERVVVNNGRDFHAMLAHAAEHNGALPDEHDNRDMLDVAKEYLQHRPLPEGIISAERGYFALIGPDVYIRITPDLVYKADRVRCRDYKTFQKAPSLDVDMDFQSQRYLFVLEQALGEEAEFEWEYVRQELGRYLKGGKGSEAVWTPWEEHERYIQQSLVLTAEEREKIRHDMYDAACEIRATIERGYWRRQVLKSGPHGCEGCFFKAICKADWQDTLDAETLAVLTEQTDPSDRVLPATMFEDPRVQWYMAEQNMADVTAIEAVYGTNGRAKYAEFLKAA